MFCLSLGLRLLTDHGTTDIQESTALNYKYDEIDIYSNSWGPSDTGFTVSGPGLLTKMALENGVTKVRTEGVLILFNDIKLSLYVTC